MRPMADKTMNKTMNKIMNSNIKSKLRQLVQEVIQEELLNEGLPDWMQSKATKQKKAAQNATDLATYLSGRKERIIAFEKKDMEKIKQDRFTAPPGYMYLTFRELDGWKTHIHNGYPKEILKQMEEFLNE